MSKDNVIGLEMGLDVTDLKLGIQQVGKTLKEARNNFNLATAGMDKWTKSSDGLTAKLDQLETQLAGQKKTVDLYRAEIERVSKQEGDHSKELENLQAKLQKAEIEVKKTESSIRKYSDSLAEVTAENRKAESALGVLTSEIEEQKKALSELEFEYKDVVLTYGKNSKQAKTLKKEIQSLSGELSDNEEKLRKSEKALEAFTAEMEDAEDGTERFQKGLEGIKGLGGLVAKGVTAIGASIAGLGASFLATAEGTREFRTNLGKLETAFSTAGLTADQASETYKQLYSVVADEGKATEASAHIAKLAKDQQDLQKWVDISTGVYATFGDSLPIESLTEASNETAKVGKVTGSLADALNWAGVNEEKFQESLDKCSNEQERQKLITDTLNGLYDEASKKYQQVNKDVIESNKSQVTLTETMAQLGEKAEPIMTTVKDGFNQILQVVLELVEGADFEAIQAGIDNAFKYFIDTIVPAIKDGFKWIMDNKDPLVAGIVAIGTAMLAWNVVSIIQGVVGAIKGWIIATEGMTVAQRALNLVMKTNPIGIVITAITALVSAFIYLWNTSDEFRAFWINLWNKVKDTTSKVVNSISKWFKDLWKDIKKAWSGTVDWFKNVWTKISDGFKSALSAVSKFFSNAWKSIKSAWSNVVSWFKNIGNNIANAFKNATKKVQDFFKNAWSNVKKVWNTVVSWFKGVVTKIINSFKTIGTGISKFFKTAWDNVKKVWGKVSSWFINIKTRIVNGFKSLPSSIKNLFVTAWNNVKTAWGKVTGFFADIKTKIINSFKSLPSSMLSVGNDLVKGLWNGVKDMASWISGKLKNFSDDVLGGIKKFFGIKSPSRKMAEVGKFLAEGLGMGIEDNTDVVTKATDKVSNHILNKFNKLNKDIERFEFARAFEEMGVELDNPFEGITGQKLTDEINNKINPALNELKLKAKDAYDVLAGKEAGVDTLHEFQELESSLVDLAQKQLEKKQMLEAKMKRHVEMGEEGAENYERTQQWIEIANREYEATISNLEIVQNQVTAIKEEQEELANTPTLDMSDSKSQWKEAWKQMFGMTSDGFDQLDDDVKDKVSGMVDKIKDIGSSISNIASQAIDLFNQAIENQITQLDSELEQYSAMKEEELEVAEERYEAEKAALEAKNNAGKLSDAQYQANLDALEQSHKQKKLAIEQEIRVAEEETLRKKNELAEKQFNAQKATSIAEAVIAGAQAIVKGFAQLGPIGGAINAGIQAALTATQIGIIASQKYVPMLAKGGIVDGATTAIIGEAGKEAVLPLENNTGWMDDLARKLASIMKSDLVGAVAPAGVVYSGDVYNTYNYNQIINAPKSPSRKEIYRDTKNLLALKGV